MPECTDIVGAIELTSFLLFDGQADAGRFYALLPLPVKSLFKGSSQNSKLTC